MASCANGLKLAEETIKKGRRIVFWGILLAILVTLFSSIWAILDLGLSPWGDQYRPLLLWRRSALPF